MLLELLGLAAAGGLLKSVLCDGTEIFLFEQIERPSGAVYRLLQ